MARHSQNASYKSVQGLSRGLILLEALNIAGRAQTAIELSHETGLHRTTVRRLLHTLTESGFVIRSEAEDTYRLTKKVRHLSDGFTPYDSLSNIAMPILGELMQSIVSPSSLCVPDFDGMQIWESTHRFSPFSFHRGMRQRKIPFLLSASGRAYFAFSDEAERIEIVRVLAQKDNEEGQLARNPSFIENLVASVHKQGFSTNFGEWAEEKKVGAISMPLFKDTKVLGSLTVIFLAHALKPEKAIETFVGPLDTASKKISTLLSLEEAN